MTDNVYRIVTALSIASHYPATLFSLGNTALAYYVAGPFGIFANMTLTAAVFIVKVFEHYSGRRIGVPFGVLGTVNIFTALSIEAKLFAEVDSIFVFTQDVLSAHVAAFAFVSWAIGHYLVSMHQHRDTKPGMPLINPQVFYGVSDITSIHAAGIINWYALPLAILGLIKSFFAGVVITFKSKILQGLYREVTSARLYGLSYLIGALFSFANPSFAFAQFCWALAYFHFKKYS